MHLNHYFFKHLSRELNAALKGAKVLSCFSQEKDELIIEFSPLGDLPKSFFVRASFNPEASFLAFPKTYSRARNNTVNLFDEVIGNCLNQIWVAPNERVLIFELANNLKWVFKFHGKRSNLLLFDGGQLQSSFRTKLNEELIFKFEAEESQIPFQNLWFANAEFKKQFVSLGPIATQYLVERGFFDADLETQKLLLADLELQLNKGEFYLIKFNGAPEISLLPVGEVLSQLDKPTQALNAFVLERMGNWQLQKEKLQVESRLREALKRSEAYLKLTSIKLLERQNETPPETLGHLLMAYGWQIEPGATEVLLPDFNTQNLVSVKLKPELNAIQNAEIYYRKSKNRQIELERLESNIAFRENKMLQWREWLENLSQIQDLKELRKLAGQIVKETPTQDDDELVVPYYSFYVESYEIRVGKNAQANDRLLSQFSHKNDTWLHARDTPGSHVIILNRENKKIPTAILEKAAGLAAYYSKRKGETLCPVSYTLRKFVQKPKGWAPGKVKLLREEVLMVEPKPH